MLKVVASMRVSAPLVMVPAEGEGGVLCCWVQGWVGSGMHMVCVRMHAHAYAYACTHTQAH